MEGVLSPDELTRLREEFAAKPSYRLMQNAVTRASIDDIALDREIVNSTAHTFSTVLDDWKVTDQRVSGRCWLFAGLNLLRASAMKQMGLKEFEFSQNHAMFWDKIERANYVLEALIATCDRDLDDRTVAYLLDVLADDGGQWNMFVAIIQKHGLVPKEAMPETESSS
ncbi:MAG: C1 family peptidase, partial [Candidatus Dormibacteria bacterium]